ncbi:MAG: hypothetical protein ACTSRP_21215 [Candidatus Helarchaeota archaeon]
MSLMEKRKPEKEEDLDDKTIEELEEELLLLQTELARKTVTTKELIKNKVKPKETLKTDIQNKQTDTQTKQQIIQQPVIKNEKTEKKTNISKATTSQQIQKPVKKHMESKIRLRKKITKKDQLEIEADFYSCIATLNSVIKNFEEGKLDPPTYKRQLRSLMRDAFKAQLELKEIDHNIEAFLKRENIIEKFPYAAQKLRLGERSSIEISPLEIATVSTAQIAAMSSDLVSHFITISDYTKLDMAKISLIMPILDDILLILEKFPAFGKEYWVYKAVNQWREKLALKDPNEILDADENSRLELDVVRWAQDFKRRLQDL